jgi:hypothetical protein
MAETLRIELDPGKAPDLSGPPRPPAAPPPVVVPPLPAPRAEPVPQTPAPVGAAFPVATPASLEIPRMPGGAPVAPMPPAPPVSDKEIPYRSPFGVPVPPPRAEVPPVPGVTIPAPEVSIPPVPKVEIPPVPGIEMPAPEVETPDAATVTVPAPTVDVAPIPPVPGIEVPAPEVGVAPIPPVAIPAPEIGIPPVPGVEIPPPSVTIPPVPGVEVPAPEVSVAPIPPVPAPVPPPQTITDVVNANAPRPFDPVAEAQRRMNLEQERAEQERKVDAARRLVDKEYAERRTKEEELDRKKSDLETRRLDPVFRVREQMEQEFQRKRDAEENERIRRRMDPEYDAARTKEEKGKRGQERSDFVRKVDQKAATAVSVAGQVTSPIAALDAGGLAVGFQAVATQLPVFGQTLGVAIGAVRAFSDGLSRTIDKMAQYSPDVAMAKAQSQVNEIMGDIRRSQKLGPELAQFAEARGRLGEKARDAMADILKRLLPLATKAMEWLIKGVDWVMVDLPNFFIDAINGIIKAINKLGGSIDLLERIAKNTDPKSGYNFTNPFVDDLFLSGQSKGFGPLERGHRGDDLLKMPGMEGF